MVMGMVWVRLPKARYANDLGVMGFDLVWGDVRLPPVGYANDFDDGGLGSIADGTLRERFGGGGIRLLFRIDCRWHATRTGVGRVDRLKYIYF
jgi:hypothetical protein